MSVNHFPYLLIVTNPENNRGIQVVSGSHQNLITCSLGYCQSSLKISCKSVRKLLRKAANKQTDKQRRLHNPLGEGNDATRRSVHGGRAVPTSETSVCRQSSRRSFL